MELRPTQEGVVLDFFVITNPAALLEALIVFRQTHRRLICERLSIENVYVDWRNNVVGDIRFDLRDPDLVTFVGSDFDVDSLEIAKTNLPLALRMFQHAAKEGLVEVVSAPPTRGVHLASLAGLFNSSRGGYSIDYLEHGGEDAPLMIGPDWPNTAAANLELALGSSLGLAVDDPRFQKSGADPLVESGMFAERASGCLREFLWRWEPRSFSELRGVIDNPTLLPNLVEQVTAFSEDRRYEKDLKLFFPRLAANALTSGAASHLEMLYRILRRNFDW